jgi:hypothetical protein
MGSQPVWFEKSLPASQRKSLPISAFWRKLVSAGPISAGLGLGQISGLESAEQANVCQHRNKTTAFPPVLLLVGREPTARTRYVLYNSF